MAPPKVFISYSHDSPAHEAKVLALANRLRSNGIDALLDQYESFPARGWIQWMKDQVRDAKFVLVVCTETYGRRWDGEEKAGIGLGAQFEGQTFLQQLYEAGGVNDRIIPVLLDERDRQHIPLELRKYSNFLLYAEDGYEALCGLLTGETKVPALPRREARPDFRNAIWNVPPRNVFFTGRATQLGDVRKALAKGAAAISGIGGMGKTQTAIEYAYVYRGEYKVVLWSAADSRDARISGFAALAQVLDLAQKDEKDLSAVAAAVRGWLESNSGWLLILDNVEDLKVVREFAPASGHVLITTRPHATGGIAELVELRKMTPDEGAQFLLRRAKKTDGLALAREISIEVDGLPLALDQAGAFIEETPSTFKEYLDLYRKKGAALRAQRGDLVTDHPESVAITFSLAFAKLAEAKPAAADVVRACAFLAPDAIPEEIFTEAGGEWAEPIEWLRMMKQAGKFALIQRDAESKTLYIHRLVQEVIKDEMTPETRQAWAERVVQALNKVFPVSEFPDWPRCARLIPHAKIVARLVEDFALDSPIAVRFLNVTGNYLEDRAQYGEAEPLYRRALRISERSLGPRDSNTAASCNNLGMIYHALGRYAEAEMFYGRALTIEEALGPERSETIGCLNNLATLYMTLGRHAEAETFFVRVLQTREKVFGASHPNVAPTLNNMAELYRSQGRYAEAEPLYQRALAICENIFGAHPKTAATLNNLALLCTSQDRYRDAEPLYRRALDIVEKALGLEHPNTITAIRNYASLLRKLGRDAEADKLEARLS